MNSLQYRQLAKRVDVLEALVATLKEALTKPTDEEPIKLKVLSLPKKTNNA